MLCRYCGGDETDVSAVLPYCSECIIRHYDALRAEIEAIHQRTRQEAGLPGKPPDSRKGLTCDRCANLCSIEEGGSGWCGVRRRRGDKICGGNPDEGRVHFYKDGHPTNCVASAVCPAANFCGYPRYSGHEGPEYDHYNLAVFYYSCGFNCLYCQNWSYREGSLDEPYTRAEDIAEAVKDDVTCICYFGGDPSPQMPHAMALAQEALRRRRGAPMRICWETNGSMGYEALEQMTAMSLRTGGIIKFDLKAWSDPLHRALCGVSNRQTLSNFRKVARYTGEREEYPLLVASTLLVPGYIDTGEVSAIAEFIASCSPDIPYALLAFYPTFKMHDLLPTSLKQAERCEEAALAAGLNYVTIQNTHLLS